MIGRELARHLRIEPKTGTRASNPQLAHRHRIPRVPYLSCWQNILLTIK